MLELLTASLLFAATPVPAAVWSPFPAAEDVPLQRAAREYRIRIYDTFREMRPEYDRRRAASDRLLEAYGRSGRDPADREALLAWLDAAESVSRPEQAAPLPEFEHLAAMLIANEAKPVAKANRPANKSVLAKLAGAFARAVRAGPTSTPSATAGQPSPGALSHTEPISLDNASVATASKVARDAAPAAVAVDAPVREERSDPADAGLEDVDAELVDFNRALQLAEQEMAEEAGPRVIDIARWLNNLVDLKSQREQIAARIASSDALDRELTADLLPLDPAVATLGERIASMRTQLEAGEFAESEDARQRELDLLDVLERQFATLGDGQAG